MRDDFAGRDADAMATEAAGYCALCAEAGAIVPVAAQQMGDPVGVYGGRTAYEDYTEYDCPEHGSLDPGDVIPYFTEATRIVDAAIADPKDHDVVAARAEVGRRG